LQYFFSSEKKGVIIWKEVVALQQNYQQQRDSSCHVKLKFQTWKMKKVGNLSLSTPSKVHSKTMPSAHVNNELSATLVQSI
jgi:formylmethanofuran dehydrogenase subunit E-like metal-binding protein